MKMMSSKHRISSINRANDRGAVRRSCNAVALHTRPCAIAQSVAPEVAASSLPLHRLPCGLEIRHTSTPAEVEFLHDELMQRGYLRHGVCLKPGDTVMDIGANIGLFAMAAAEAITPGGRVLCVEPSPAAAAAAAANLRAHAAKQQAEGACTARTDVVLAAAGDGSARAGSLTIYPSAAGWATLEPDDAEVEHNMAAYLHGLLLHGASTERGWTPLQRALVRAVRPLARSAALAPISRWIARAYVRHSLLSGARQLPCALTTVSELIAQHSISCIDLLKIDVERAELDVLTGVALTDWPRIQQVALEVHDINGRLAEVLQLLRERADFQHVTFEQDAQLAGSNLYGVFAVRAPRAAAGTMPPATSKEPAC